MYINRNSIVEKPCFIDIEYIEDKIVLYDYLLEKRVIINENTNEIFLLFDGINSIGDIAKTISEKYGIDEERVTKDIIELVHDLLRLRIILVKGTVTYKFLDFYYKLIFYKGYSKYETKRLKF